MLKMFRTFFQVTALPTISLPSVPSTVTIVSCSEETVLTLSMKPEPTSVQSGLKPLTTCRLSEIIQPVPQVNSRLSQMTRILVSTLSLHLMLTKTLLLLTLPRAWLLRLQFSVKKALTHRAKWLPHSTVQALNVSTFTCQTF